jgi:hypothetical protein
MTTLPQQLSRSPSPRLAALREMADAELTAEVKAERAALVCAWCANPGEIPKPSAPQCENHLALNKEYGRRINRTPFGEEHIFPALRTEIARRGLEIALAQRGVDSEPLQRTETPQPQETCHLCGQPTKPEEQRIHQRCMNDENVRADLKSFEPEATHAQA